MNHVENQVQVDTCQNWTRLCSVFQTHSHHLQGGDEKKVSQNSENGE